MLLQVLVVALGVVTATHQDECRGMLPAPIENCNEYILHHNGKPFVNECPEGLLFDKNRLICDLPENTECLKSNECIKHGIECKSDSGHPVFRPHPNCTQFCECSNGIPYVRNCPSNLHWNPILNACDWPEHAGCAAARQNTTRTTASAYTTSHQNVTTSRQNTTTSAPRPTSQNATRITTSHPHTTSQNTTRTTIPASSTTRQQSPRTTSSPNTTSHVTRRSSEASETTTPSEDQIGTEICLKEGVVCHWNEPAYQAISDCSKFCQCANGRPFLKTCPGGLHFNSRINVCDWPSQAGCDTNRTTTEKTITDRSEDKESEVNECHKEHIKCKNDSDHRVFRPHPNCTQFCECSNGVPYVRNCPSNLHWNPTLNACDWPEHAGCAAARQNTTRTTASAYTTSHQNVTTSSQNTTTSAPRTTSQNATRITTSHPHTTSQNTTRTTIPASSTTRQQSPRTTSSPNTTSHVTRRSSEASETTTPSEDQIGTEICLKEGVVCHWNEPAYQAISDCSKFCQCANGRPFLKTCPGGLHFNSRINVCDWPSQAGCDTNRTTTEKTITDRSEDKESEVNECHKEHIKCKSDSDHPVFRPHPNCTQFCECSNGVPYVRNCPSNLHWNPTLNACDWPEHAGCAAPRQNTTRTTASAYTTSHQNVTTSRQNTTTSAPRTTSQNATRITTSHPHTTSQNPKRTTIPASSTTSQHGSRTTSSPNTTSHVTRTTEASETTTPSDDQIGTEICLKEGVVCHWNEPAYQAISDCSKFCQCANGRPFLKICPGGLHFNSRINVCDWPSQAGCDTNRTTTEKATTDRFDDKETEVNADRFDDKETEVNACHKEHIKCPVVDPRTPVYRAVSDCHQFCECANGRPFLFDCPDGTLFNEKLNVCDHAYNVKCNA